MIGVRLKINLAQSLDVTTAGFVGKGGSRCGWGAFGGPGYAFIDRVSAFAGYRAMKGGSCNGNSIFDAPQQGPALRVDARF